MSRKTPRIYESPSPTKPEPFTRLVSLARLNASRGKARQSSAQSRVQDVARRCANFPNRAQKRGFVCESICASNAHSVGRVSPQAHKLSSPCSRASHFDGAMQPAARGPHGANGRAFRATTVQQKAILSTRGPLVSATRRELIDRVARRRVPPSSTRGATERPASAARSSARSCARAPPP